MLTTGTLFRAIAAAALLAWQSAAPATSDPWTAAVNTAGRQRMLTQRMVRSYAAIGLGALPERARGDLRAAASLYRSQLDALREMALDPRCRAAIADVAKIWRRFEPAVTGEVDRASFVEVDGLGERLLAASDRLVTLIERRRGQPADQLVNLSGRQRMLSQRLAKLYLMRSWGFGGATLERAMTSAKQEFTAALDTLFAARENTAEILDELALVNVQWTWFEFALALRDTGTYQLVVLDASESILTSMEAITAMYESISPR